MTIKEQINQSDYNQSEIAKLLGVTPGTITNWVKHNKVSNRHITNFKALLEPKETINIDHIGDVGEFIFSAIESNRGEGHEDDEPQIYIEDENVELKNNKDEKMDLFPFAHHVKSGDMYYAGVKEFKNSIGNWTDLKAYKTQGFEDCIYSIRLNHKPTKFYLTAYYNNLQDWLAALETLAPLIQSTEKNA